MQLNRKFQRKRLAAMLVAMIFMMTGVQFSHSEPLVAKFLDQVDVSVLVKGADSFGELRTDIPVVPAL